MPRLPNMVKPAGKATRHELTYYDGERRIVYTVDEGYNQNDGTILISRTDASGIITHVNRVFTEISGYSQRELIGAPHYIIRHPDMPKSAFKDLWDTIIGGSEWHGYVKNLRKDGRYYWVYATVAPIISNGLFVGSTSVRRKVDAKTIAKYEEQYRIMRQNEERYGFEDDDTDTTASAPGNSAGNLIGKLFTRKK